MSELDLQLRYSWDWFAYHAQQRLTAFNFFLVLMGAVAVGYTQALTSDIPELGVAVGVLGAFVALAFWAMDVRNAELVACGRAALDHVEAKLALSIGSEANERVRLKGALPGRVQSGIHGHIDDQWFTHRRWLRSVIFVMGLLCILAAVWAGTGFLGASRASASGEACHGSKTSPCWSLRSSSYGTPTRR